MTNAMLLEKIRVYCDSVNYQFTEDEWDMGFAAGMDLVASSVLDLIRAAE